MVVGIVLLLLARVGLADSLTGLVTHVTDGDTLTLLIAGTEKHKIRVAGIDAPERTQSYGSQSTANLVQQAFNKAASADCHKVDRYGRDICTVFVDGRDVGLQQIADGLAWWYRKYANEQSTTDQQSYERAETTAKQNRLGLWSESDPMAPWHWRRERR
jgi:endonuclease YncB( thermonuclease family)